MPGIAHTPVMLEEVLAYLVPRRDDALMLDCTLGEGGHAAAFLGRYPSLRYVGLDADPAIQDKARARLAPYGDRVEYRLGYFDELLANWSGPGPGLVLFDLGISMFHFTESGRGFTLAKDEALDMRLSPEAPRSAAELLASEREEELARIIYEYGEERLSRRIAAAIVAARRTGGTRTSAQLAKLVWNAVPSQYRHGRIHPATRTFQALRIAVNDELGRAERGIRRAAALLEPEGLIAIISFHSLEDRIAKNVLRELSGRSPAVALPTDRPSRGDYRPSTRGSGAPIDTVEGGALPSLELVTKKPIEPSAEEIERNPASRSAKLRVARKVDGAARRTAA